MNPKLLVVHASPRTDRSASRHLASAFIQSWSTAHGASVATRDLSVTAPPFVTEAHVAAYFTPAADRTSEQRALLVTSDAFVAELKAATHLMITTPMYNFGMPAQLKAWFDQIVRVGETFTVDASGLRGLLKGKKALVLVATGSDFRPGAAYAAADFLSPHARAVLGFVGITDVEVVHISNQTGSEDEREAGRRHANATLAKLVDGW